MKCASLITATVLMACGIQHNAWAVDYLLPAENSRLIGENQRWTVQEDDRNLQAIARRFDTAAMLILEANDTLAPVHPQVGTEVLIPTRLLLPDVPREGIVVNLAELRLYYFPPGKNQVQVYPLGIGQAGLETPEMTTRVGQKIPNPSWTPPAGIRARSRAKGITLPPVVPAGPGNPLGKYALRLTYGNGEYLIHGTNASDSVGLRVSSGCMRMNAADIQALFSQVTVGTPVRVINQPVKFSLEPNGEHYVEVHRPLSPDETANTRTLTYTHPAAFHEFAADHRVDSGRLKTALARRAGYPVSVSREERGSE